MSGHVSISQVTRSFLTSEREQIFHLDNLDGARCCYVFSCLLLLPHSPVTVEAISHLCISEQNRPMPVWRQLSLIHAGLEKLIPGGIGPTSPMCLWSHEVLFCQFMLHLYFAHCFMVPD